MDGAETKREAAHAVNAEGAGNLARAAPRSGAPLAAHLDRLRLRRHAAARRRWTAAALPGVRSHRPPLGVRRDQARGRAPGAGGFAEITRSCARPGCTGWTGATSSTRCCVWRASARPCRSSTTRSARPRGPGISRPPLLGLLERQVSGLVHLTGAGEVSWNGFAAGDLPPGRGRVPRRAGHQRADGASGAASRLVGARLRTRRCAADAAVAGRPGRLSRGPELG